MFGVISTIWTYFDQHIDTVLSGCHSTIGCICSCLEDLNPAFAYCEFLGCIPGDVVASAGYNVRAYVNNNIQTWPDGGQIARSAGYQQLHWLDVRVAIPPLFTTWIDHKRSLITGRFTVILWSIFIHLFLHRT